MQSIKIGNYLMILLYILGVIFFVWTIFVVMYQYIAAIGIFPEIIHALSNSRLLSALWLSLTSAFVTSVIAFIFGVPLAYIFATREFPGKILIENISIDIPQTFPPIAEGIILFYMLGPNSLLHINLAYTFWALVLAKLFVSGPFVVALTTRKFSEIKASGLDIIASSLGAHTFQIFTTLYIPLAFKDIMGGVVLCWSRAMGELGGSMIFAGIIPFKTEIIPTLISVTGSQELGMSLAATMLVTTASIIALIFFKLATPGGALWKALFYRI